MSTVTTAPCIRRSHPANHRRPSSERDCDVPVRVAPLQHALQLRLGSRMRHHVGRIRKVTEDRRMPVVRAVRVQRALVVVGEAELVESRWNRDSRRPERQVLDFRYRRRDNLDAKPLRHLSRVCAPAGHPSAHPTARPHVQMLRLGFGFVLIMQPILTLSV